MQGWGAWPLGAAAVVVIAVGGVFILRQPSPEPDPTPPPVAALPETPEAPAAPEADPAPEVASPDPAPPEPAAPLMPSFDVVRIKPDGGAVVAGRTEPSAPVAVLIDDLVTAETKADGEGNFVALFDLPPADVTRVMTLRATLPDGSLLLSESSVIVEAVAPVEVAQAPEPAPVPEPAPQPAPDPEPAPEAGTTPETAPAGDPQTEPPSAPPSEPESEPDAAPDPEAGPSPETVPVPDGDAVAEAPAETPTGSLTDAPADMVADAPADMAADAPEEAAEIAADTPVDTAADTPADTADAPTEAPDVAAAAPETIEPAPGPDTAPDDLAALDTAPEAGAPGAPDAAGEGAAPETPRVLLAGPEGITVLQDSAPDAPMLSIDTISYDDGGEVALAGRGAADDRLRIYLDNLPVFGAEVGPDGQWRAPLPEVAPGIYTLRVDAVAADGSVTSRVETPFKREDPDVLEAAQAEAEAATDAGRRIASITVQKDDTLWAIARDRYGEGMLYVKVFEANRGQIRDPHWIYPGQVFTLPDDGAAPEAGK